MLLTRNRPRLWRYGLASSLALLSNYLFTGEWLSRFKDAMPLGWQTSQTFGLVALVFAIFFAGVAFNRRDNFSENRPPTALQEKCRLPAWIWGIPCLILYLAASVMFWFLGESALVRWLWLFSVLSLIATHLRNSDFSDFWPINFGEYVMLVSVTIAAFALRYVDLTQIPLNVHNDVSIMGQFSRRMIEEENWRWIGMASTSHQFSEQQFLSWSMRLFGRDHYGLVMFSVIAGTATVPVIYFIGKIAFNRWVGIVAAAFLSMDYVHIHFSRIVFGPVTTFFVALACLFLIHGLKRANRLSFILSGISLGLGMLGYYSGRVGPVIVGSIFLFWLFRRRKLPRITLASWWLLGLGAAAAFGPNLAYGIKEYRSFQGRGNEVLLWTENAWRHSSEAKYQSNGNPLIVWKEQLQRTFLAPFLYGDASPICGLPRPMLGGLAVVFFILGLGFIATRLWDLSCLLPVLWIGLTFICGGVLTIDPPFWPHLNIATPAMALIAGIGAERLTRRMILEFGARSTLILPPLLTVGLILSALNNWEVYYRYASVHARARVLATRLIESLPPEYRVFLISNSTLWEHDSFQFFVPYIAGANLSEADVIANPPAIEQPTAFFVFHDVSQSTLDALIERYPWARRRAYDDGWGGYTFTLIQVFPKGYVLPSRQPSYGIAYLGEVTGWRFVFCGVVIVVFLGWRIIDKEFKIRRERVRKLTS